MKYTSAFEIIGPVMVGPSSSHTAGAVRIANIARQILAEPPREVEFQLMGSFAKTYQGHGTDLALIAGILGAQPASEQIRQAGQLAKKHGLVYRFTMGNRSLVHPNTVLIQVRGETSELSLLASSLGGGKVEVQELDGLPVRFTADRPTLILYHRDQKGFLAKISQLLDQHGYNIARLALERIRKAGLAITVCEVDEVIRAETLQLIEREVPMLTMIRSIQIV